MSKFLQIMVVLILLLAGAVAFLEYRVFARRLELKHSVQTLEANLVQVAEILAAGREPYIEPIDQKVDRNSLMQSAAMARQIRVVETLVENRYDQLYAAKDDLKRTTDELNQTKQELARTRQELEDTRRQIAGVRQRIAEKEAELASVEREIGARQEKIGELNRAIEQNKEQIAKLDNDKADLKDEVRRLELELARYLNDPNIVKQMPRGLNGNIVAVNTEWNFVVLDIGSREGLVKDAYMLVHRGDQLIGKVRITQAAEHMAIADIENEWAVSPMEEGDRVLY